MLTLATGGIALVAAAATMAVVKALERRGAGPLRRKLVHLFIGLAAAEAASTPALAMALWGGDAFGLEPTGAEPWLVGALYVVLTAYVLRRLFPWREVNAMAEDPDISLKDAMARLAARNETGDGGGD